MCCGSWGRKESDTTEQLNRNAKRPNVCLRRPYKELRKKRREVKGKKKMKKRKGKIQPSECRVPKESKER